MIDLVMQTPLAMRRLSEEQAMEVSLSMVSRGNFQTRHGDRRPKVYT